MEYLFILRFKGPLRFSMFRTCLSRKLAWPCVFLSGLRDFSCRAPFWRPCTFACVPVNFFNRFLSLRCSTVTLRGGSACMFLHLLVLMRQPPAKVKNREIAFVFCFGLPSVWERSTKLRIHRSHSCNFFYHAYSRILAPYCNSSHITKAIAIE